MSASSAVLLPYSVALLAEGVDRNFIVLTSVQTPIVALLAEGVDRNCLTPLIAPRRMAVALLAEGVDRNSTTLPGGGRARVALLAEGVDRNFFPLCYSRGAKVALLAEGVDRNVYWARLCALSSRRPPRGGRG